MNAGRGRMLNQNTKKARRIVRGGKMERSYRSNGKLSQGGG